MSNFSAGVKRILVVEDEPGICDVCRRVLTTEGFEVTIAANGKVAQDVIRGKQYDLCLVDVRTPTMSGKKLYMWLKEKHPGLASRVIFTSGDVMGGDTQRFLKLADRPFLPKPFTTHELRTIVREAFKEPEK